jgi:uncharacterized membrane protein
VIPGRLSTTQRWLRYYTFVLGAFLLIWLPLEDSNQQLATAFAAAISAALAAQLVIRSNSFQTVAFLKYLLLGGAAGLVVGPLTFLLMAIKTGLHGHAAPDFTSAQVIEVFLRMPIWGLGGLLIGLGIGLWPK